MSPKLTFMLPIEIIQFVVVPFLKVRDIFSLQGSCREYREMDVWKDVVKRDFGKEVKRDSKEEYKLLRMCYISDERIREVCEKYEQNPEMIKRCLARLGWEEKGWNGDELIKWVRVDFSLRCEMEKTLLKDYFPLAIHGRAQVIHELIYPLGFSTGCLCISYSIFAKIYDYHNDQGAFFSKVKSMVSDWEPFRDKVAILLDQLEKLIKTN